MIVLVVGEAETEKSGGTMTVRRDILFPVEVCSVNQTLPPLSRATEFGPEVRVGSAYSVNWIVTLGTIPDIKLADNVSVVGETLLVERLKFVCLTASLGASPV